MHMVSSVIFPTLLANMTMFQFTSIMTRCYQSEINDDSVDKISKVDVSDSSLRFVEATRNEVDSGSHPATLAFANISI